MRRALALILLVLAGCGGGATEAARRPAPVDEAAQAERNAGRTLAAFCLDGDGRARDAVRAISLLIRHAREDIAAGTDEDNLAWREELGYIAGRLEHHECLPAQVPRIDRALRRLPLPELYEPEYDYAPEYEYEPYP